jgi:hypothetical protein
MAAITKETLLRKLPPYRDEWKLITPDQTVKDIIVEVLNAHEEFSPYYDKIALYFNDDKTDNICERLYRFCKKEIRYHEETEDDQTTALPTGVLLRGYGDCKHYAGFIGGVLGALNRQGKKIKWNYRFASYEVFDKTPHHVFIVVRNSDGSETWIDPTPGAHSITPVWMTDKKIDTMALHRNIAGTNTGVGYNVTRGTIGGPQYQIVSQEGAVAGTYPINYNVAIPKNPYFAGAPFLAMTIYSSDPYSKEGTSWETLANEINQKIATGPQPGHTVTPQFVQWIYDTNNKAWNFYFADGVTPGYVPANFPAAWPRPLLTEDNLRLTFDKQQPVDDGGNNEIFALTAWLQDLINEHDTTPYPLQPRAVKEFSQGKFGGIDKMNFFTEAKGAGFLKELGKAIGNTLKAIEGGALKIIGSIPRNAFLALVGINAFNFAHNLDQEIQNGKWDKISTKWKHLGGNPEKLKGTINHGKGKKAILGAEPATTTTFLASAVPIIVALLEFLNKDGKLDGILKAAKTGLKTAFPKENFDFIDGAITNNGQRLQFAEVDPRDNENLGGGNNDLPSGPASINNRLLVAGAIGLGASFLIKKQGKPNFLLGILLGGAYYMLPSITGPRNTSMLPNQPINFLPPTQLTTETKRAALIQWSNSSNTDGEEAKQHINTIFRQMLPGEIDITYTYVFDYFLKDKEVPENSQLYTDIMDISDKYDIFS